MVDAVLGRVHASFKVPFNQNMGSALVGSALMAPVGYYFVLYFQDDPDQPRTETWSWAKITNQGTTPQVKLPRDTRNAAFSADGRFLYFARGSRATDDDPRPARTLHIIELPGDTAREITIPSRVFTGSFAVGTGSKIYAGTSGINGGYGSWYEVGPSGTPERITPSGSMYFLRSSGDSLLGLNEGLDDIDLELWLRGSTEEVHLLRTYQDYENSRFYVDFYAGHVRYTNDDGLHVAGIDASGLYNVIVANSSEVDCLETVGDLMWHRDENGALAFFSLKNPAAVEIARVPLSADATGRSCPVKHTDKDKLVYVEYTATKSEIWVVDANSDGVDTPSKYADVDLDTRPYFQLTPELFGG